MPNPEIRLELLRRLIHVISVLLNGNERFPLHQVIVDRTINHDALRGLERFLGLAGRHDVLDILHKTRAGDQTLLEQYENALPHMDRFHNTFNPVSEEWPSLCYRYTQNNNPIQAESGYTMNGNPFAMESEGPINCNQNDEREGYPHDRHQPQPEESNLRFPTPFIPLQEHPPEQPRQDRVQCCICWKDIQDNEEYTDPFWEIMENFIQNLAEEKLTIFIAEVNLCTGGLFYPGRISPHNIVRRLRGWNGGPDSKCVVCLVNHAFQSSGCFDMARQLKEIWNGLHG